MLFNIDRAERLLAREGLDAVVGASPENVLYMSGFECTTHWINKGFQQYAVFSPGHDPRGTLIAPGLEIDSLVEGENWMDDVIVFSPFPRGAAAAGVPLDDVGRRGRELTDRAVTVATAIDGLCTAIEARGLTRGRIGFDETGMSMQALEELRARLANAELIPAGALLWEIRMVKTPEEIARIERATQISEDAIRAAYGLIRPGLGEHEIVDAYHREIAARDGRSTFCIVASGPRSSYPHAMRSTREIAQGDIVRYDVGCTYRYYHSDHARAVVVGRPTDEQRRVWDALSQGVDDAVAATRPGATPVDLFNVAMAPARRLGLNNFDRFHCGHGVGISVYDPPIITAADPTRSAFRMPAIEGGLEAGMVINIEVGYYIQGFFGFLCEDTMEVTPGGRRVMTRNSKSLDLRTFLEG